MAWAALYEGLERLVISTSSKPVPEARSPLPDASCKFAMAPPEDQLTPNADLQEADRWHSCH